MTKHGVARPIVIPMHAGVAVGTIQSNLRTAGLSRDQLINWLEEEPKK